ncbi:MAG TPA: ATP-binding protein [Thermodesulfovibrionia bacterium]|nr:ATP-binding protein [Thermodesulfovibrionia bacterium]
MPENDNFETGLFFLTGGDFDRAGEASSELRKVLLSKDISLDIIRRASIAAFEAEINVIVYATAGMLRFTLDDKCLHVVVEDMGPGIEDINLAMQEGYSTASEEVRAMGWGAGMGLPNMKKNADEFLLLSDVGIGTTVELVFYLKPKRIKTL